MVTTLSTKGQIVLPREIRQKLGLRAGMKFTQRIENGSIVVTPITPSVAKPQSVADPETGLMITQNSENSPSISSKDIRAILADFP